MQLVAPKQLKPGAFYELLSPNGGIHRVTATSATPWVSLHRLGNDTGCVWRHRYDIGAGASTTFRSGYTHRPCDQMKLRRPGVRRVAGVSDTD